MKKILILITLLGSIFLLSSCEKSNNKSLLQFNVEYYEVLNTTGGSASYYLNKNYSLFFNKNKICIHNYYTDIIEMQFSYTQDMLYLFNEDAYNDLYIYRYFEIKDSTLLFIRASSSSSILMFCTEAYYNKYLNTENIFK